MFAVCLATLYVFIFMVFPNTRLQTEQVKVKPPKIDRFLFISSLLLLAVFITALELHFVTYLIPALILWFFIVKKEVFFKFDWFLIITFMLMFIDFNILSKYPFLQNSINSFDLNFKNVMNLSILTSQIMSNVPAAIFMSKFSHNYLAIAYGVNIAGNGFIIASLANIIAIRILKKGFVEFHKYSIPYFLITYIITVLFIF
jgi:Na+/H+ antiporter NhaD/arsenite permease-like protein